MVKSIPDGFVQCGIVVAAAPCIMIEEEGEERGGGEGGEQQCDDASGLMGNRFCLSSISDVCHGHGEGIVKVVLQ